MASLSELGLTPTNAPPPDAMLLARVERFLDLRPVVMADNTNLAIVKEYAALKSSVCDTRALTPVGARAKLEAALITLGADKPGWRDSIWELPIMAIQDALRVGI